MRGYRVSDLERLAKAVLEGRVSIEPQYASHVERPWAYRVLVEPDPEEEAIESIKRGHA